MTNFKPKIPLLMFGILALFMGLYGSIGWDDSMITMAVVGGATYLGFVIGWIARSTER